MHHLKRNLSILRFIDSLSFIRVQADAGSHYIIIYNNYRPVIDVSRETYHVKVWFFASQSTIVLILLLCTQVGQAPP